MSLVAAALGGARDAQTTSGVSQRKAGLLPALQPLSVAGCARAGGHTSGTREAQGTGQGQLPNNTHGSGTDGMSTAHRHTKSRRLFSQKSFYCPLGL